MISLCFRYDDPSPTSDHALEKKIIEVMRQNRASASFAVIPFRRPEKEGELLRWSVEKASHLVDAAEQGILEIAQHGTTHTHLSETESGIPSEFCGLPYSRQIDRIRDGLDELETVFGKRISGFVPPWNTYDENTTKAVEETGLTYLSPSLDIFKYGNLPIIPKTCNFLGAQSAIDEAIRFESLNPAVVIVLHPYQFEEFHKQPTQGERPPFINIKKLGELVNRVQSIDKVKIQTLGELAERDSGQYLLWRFEDIAWFKHLPYRIKKHFPRNILIQGNRIKSFLEIARVQR